VLPLFRSGSYQVVNSRSIDAGIPSATLHHVAGDGDHRKGRHAADDQDQLEKQLEDIGMDQFHGNDTLVMPAKRSGSVDMAVGA